MRYTLTALAGLSILGTAAAAQEYRPPFRPDMLKSPAGRSSEVLVLGTAHLSGWPKGFDPAILAPLIDKLAAWRPTGIATEDLSGLQCDALRRYPQRYADTVKTYCWDPAPAAKATGLSVPEATAEAERLLAEWPANPSAAQRRRLAALFLAGGERGSALVQWLRLPAAERRAGDGLDAELVTYLEAYAKRPNETGMIGAVLAARLGLERLYSVDDHSADTPDPADPKAQGEAIMRAWDNPASKARRAEDERLQAGLTKPGGVLAYYRAINRADMPALVYRSDFGAALAEPSPQRFGAGYVGYWETRNLRMVGNIRDVLGQHAGMRMLAIVGLSHRGYYEAYLNQMHDVRLADPAKVLR